MAKPAPRVVVFAGPNGAGKTTHAERVLHELGIGIFVNADFIARGLAGTNAEGVAFAAGKLMLKRLHQLADEAADFGFESTLASRSFAPFLLGLKRRGYRVSIFYFSLRSPSLAVRRIKARVRLGGHSVPEDVARRRFQRSLANLFGLYLPLADDWTVSDNSSNTGSVIIAVGDGKTTDVKDAKPWKRLQQVASPSVLSSTNDP